MRGSCLGEEWSGERMISLTIASFGEGSNTQWEAFGGDYSGLMPCHIDGLLCIGCLGRI
jgi:hypothetical protein